MKELCASEQASLTLERRVLELSILHDVSRALQKTVDEPKALHIILVGVTAGWGLGFNRAFILLLDEGETTLSGRLAVGPETPEEAHGIWQELGQKHESLSDLLTSVASADIKRDHWINELAARIRIPAHADEDPLLRIMRSHEAGRALDGLILPHGIPVGEDLVRLLGTSEFAIAPLFLGEKDLGLLIADNAITRAPIESGALGLLEIYAQEASAAIQNTRLYRQLTDQIRISEARNVSMRANQQHLLDMERLSTMGRLATLLAFRIRAPLASIGGFARRIARAMPHLDARREEMNIVIAEVSRLERLVEEVLAYRRIMKPDFRATDLNALIRIVTDTMQDEMQRNSVRCVLHLNPDLPAAWIDELQVRQTLMNLATNALDAMPKGGTLTIATTGAADFQEIEVSDTGIGIPRQNWGKLFKTFFTTKTTGTGLGLAIVSQVVEAHKGALRFRSLPGEGTSFFVRLAVGSPVGTASPQGPVARPRKEQVK
jgi:signal transduction histidine kinase